MQPFQANFYKVSLYIEVIDHFTLQSMSITNLIIKPFTSFVLYRLYQERGGQYGDFNFPGMPGFGVGGKYGSIQITEQ